jgi:hypothetical protein
LTVYSADPLVRADGLHVKHQPDTKRQASGDV